MKIKVGTMKAEGMEARFAFLVEGGLLLQTQQQTLWIGKEDRDKLKAQFDAFINELEAKGFEVER